MHNIQYGQRSSLHDTPAGTQTVKSQDTVKVLGVMLDSKMTLNQ